MVKNWVYAKIHTHQIKVYYSSLFLFFCIFLQKFKKMTHV